MQTYDPNDNHDDPLFLDHLVQRRGWSHQIRPHLIFPTKEEAFTDLIYLYIQAIQYGKDNATFEIDQLRDFYAANQHNKLGVKLENHTLDAIKIVTDQYPTNRGKLLSCNFPKGTKS